MKLFPILFLLFCLISEPKAQVDIDSADVTAEFCGPFNKTTLTLTIVNSTVYDNQNGWFRIFTNKSAFVKDLWLEMDGRYKKAINLESYTADRIYDRIRGRRKDPALLRKTRDGEFLLQVFPVNTDKARHVKIEFYSFIELAKEPEGFVWNLKLERSRSLTVRYKVNFPSGTLITDNEGRYLANNPGSVNNLEYTSHKRRFPVCMAALSVDFSRAAGRILLNDSTSLFRFTVNSGEYKKHVSLPDTVYSLPEYFRILADYIRWNNKHLFTTVESDTMFFGAFYKYLKRYKGIDVVTGSTEGSVEWKKKNRLYTFKNSFKTTFAELKGGRNYKIPGTHSAAENINCSYLREMMNYMDELSDSAKSEDKYSFLMENSSKLVLEDNAFTKKVYEEEISREKSLPSGSSNNPEKEEAFSYIEEMPVYPGGQDSLIRYIHNNLYYPKAVLEGKVSGKVFVLFTVEKDGSITNVGAVRKLDPACDMAAERLIRMMPKWAPVRFKDERVKVNMVAPIDFNRDNFDSNKTKISYLGKAFTRIDENKFQEEGFDVHNSIKVKFLSRKYFDLLLNNPALIDYTYALRNVGLFDDVTRKWILFEE